MQNYFQLFSLEENFIIDLKALEDSYQTQVAKFHPDKFVKKDDKQKQLSLQNTSLLNTAFNILKSPLSRAVYLLELQGINAFEEKDTSLDLDFLANQIELREELEDIESNNSDLTSLDKFIDNIDNKIKENITKIEKFFLIKDFLQAKNSVRELKFYFQLSEQANDLMNERL
jgi:molecular chaperone HscB